MATNSFQKASGVLNPITHGFMSVLVYGMIFVSLMVAFNGPITFETLFMPAFFIYVVVRVSEYLTVKKMNRTPSWLAIGAFGIAVLTASGMTMLLLS
ncbi:hypothetical protein JF544_10065 [Halobacillus kuroshimensis]|uniref:Uncharacterized protein n=1 Tax=Halobacillus kuroshimensis TaxID=302481 RepID=A0ABS3DW98_9BACI|nr:hypothetical protein [Halobacillus kuroshimensis]MBN8235593.1 hypothetical protein [Halobacillus kuroshimensis]